MILNKQLFVLFALRCVLGFVFVYAGVNKIMDPVGFSETILNYQLLPEYLINPVAIALPWLELIIGILLIAGIWPMGTVFLCNVLLLIFFGALFFNMLRGINVDCGCFSARNSGLEVPSMTWYFLRDIFFLLMGILLFRQVFNRKN